MPFDPSINNDVKVQKFSAHTKFIQAEIIAEYQVQEVYSFTGTADVQTVYPTTDWQQYTVHLTAPAGIWQTFIRLRAAGGVVDFDAVEHERYVLVGLLRRRRVRSG